MTEDLNKLGVAIMDYIFKFLLMEYNCMFTEDNGLVVGGVISVVCKMLEAMNPSFSLSSIVIFILFYFFGGGSMKCEEERRCSGGKMRERDGGKRNKGK